MASTIKESRFNEILELRGVSLIGSIIGTISSLELLYYSCQEEEVKDQIAIVLNDLYNLLLIQDQLEDLILTPPIYEARVNPFMMLKDNDEFY